MSETTTPEPTEPTERNPRGPLTLTRPVKLTIEGATLVQAKRSPQIHVLVADKATTLCNINTAKWVERVDVPADARINCPVCAKMLKQAAKDATTDGPDGPDTAAR